LDLQHMSRVPKPLKEPTGAPDAAVAGLDIPIEGF